MIHTQEPSSDQIIMQTREPSDSITMQAQKPSSDQVIMQTQDLCKWFPSGKTMIKAVSNVSLQIRRGETLGIVGESGCGKSTLGRTMIRLLKPTSGKIYWKGEDITDLNDRKMRRYRKSIQIIFQDPFASLDPRMNVEQILTDALQVQKLYHDRQGRRQRVLEVMELCGLDREYLHRYPHQFSGGQRQRIGIARAIAVDPELIICDEPVSALDVSIQSQILNLLTELREKLGLTLVFISHDLSVVNYISDHVAVMYLGSIIEYGSRAAIFEHPAHPYTRALLSSIPRIG